MSAASLGSAGIIGAFFERLHTSTGLSYLPDIAFRLDSDQEIETIKWLGQVPAMREWVGGRKPRAFRDNGFTIRNLKFESSIQVTLDEIRRDKTSQVMAGQRSRRSRGLAPGVADLDPDPERGDRPLLRRPVFLRHRPHRGRQFDQPVEFDHLRHLRRRRRRDHDQPDQPHHAARHPGRRRRHDGFKDDQNEPCNEFLTDFLVMVPPPLLAQGLAATVSPVSDSGSTNLIVAQNNFRIRCVGNPRLTWTDKFALFGLNGTQKPFINQVEVDTTLSAKAEGSDFEHDNDAHEYGVKRVGNAAYGDWKKGCLVTFQA
jgi:hypothetical protein